MMNDNNEEESVDAGGMSYIDRLVHELEDDESSDDEASSTNPDNAGVDGEDADSGIEEAASNVDDDDDWIYPEEDEPSDDEFEYDSEEDSVSNMFLVSSGTTPYFRTNLSEESKELLLWRLDKDVSFSDWTIQVSSTTNNEESIKKTYHVHKVTLGLGPKKSGYFEALLTSGQFSESSNSTSEVELPGDVAKYFPDFLDYLYAPPGECACLINRENRLALQYLAKYFLVPKLTEGIHNFICQDMQDLKNMEEYLIEFGEKDSEDEIAKEVLGFAARVCATNIFNIEVGSSLNYALTPAILWHIISATMIRARIDDAWINRDQDVDLSDDKRYHICRLATEYVKHYHSSLDANYFYTLTDELYFPLDVKSFAGAVAIDILEIIELAGWESLYLSSLQCVCTDILCRYLTDAECSFSKINNIAKKVPKSVMADLLTNAMIAKKAHKVESFNVSCRLESSIYGKPVGKVVKIVIKTTDSIDYVQYLLRQKLVDICMGGRLMTKLLCEDKELNNRELVMNTPITSKTVLKLQKLTK